MSYQIIVVVQPFDYIQKVYVVDATGIVEETGVIFEVLPGIVARFAKKYNTLNIDIQGDPNFTERVYQQLEKFEQEKKENENDELPD